MNKTTTTKTITLDYSPKTIAAIQFIEPNKAILLESYFGGVITPSTSIPTINLTLGIISPEMRHFSRNVGEYQAIKKSCDTGCAIHTYKGSGHQVLNDCIFAYAADLPVSVLRDLMRKRKYINPRHATLLALHELEENKNLRENNIKLKKIIDILESK